MLNIEQLTTENEALKAQSETLKAQSEALKAQLKEMQIHVHSLETLNKWYAQQLLLSRQKQFGASSERIKHEGMEQINLFNEAEAERQPITPEPTAETITSTRKKKSKRGSFSKNLPVETLEYTLPEGEQTCPQCEGALHVMKQETREELVIIPAQVKVIRHIVNHYACRNCQKDEITTPIMKAEAPAALIPRSLVSASLLSYIIVQKFINAMPLYRQEQDFKRLDVSLSRQNLSNWVIAGASLLKGLYDKLKQELLSASFLHADETTVEVLCEPDRKSESDSYMWLYRTSGDAQKAVVLYDYQQGRSGEYAKTFLDGFHGYLHVDGWKGYQKLEPDITLCGCWAHARRKFHEALQPVKEKTGTAEETGLAFCNRLFAVERKADDKNLTADERLQLRLKESKPLIEAFYSWIGTIESQTVPKSLLGTALSYAKNQRKYLTRFLENGNIELSNNRAERSIKPFVIGRKNWLFCNTPGGARSSAILYSILQTAIENNLKPLAYLTFVFDYIQRHGSGSIADILPWSHMAKSAASLS